ncbi:beta-ketoacyl-ACP synthase II [Clostridiaceae bacterium NSJ-31]|uniref:3-oxoacyl-[acyl-carrier-protein] synthase 2 n=3 Tax=Ligaoa zhengdingensis TaxID=2763658 RepID=A0A926I4A5_9FIRM|nr:beta-ketoacyl-ACP synthase II [Ligaoa zhengdingensis]MBC8546200.1 beta-ketoacyl-ACP synthase II [Ligaoa zhengdingensis]
MERRVVITGTGVISPVGNSVEQFWDSLKAGRHGIGPVASFTSDAISTKLAAEVKDFDPAAFGIDKKSARRMDRYCQFAVAAANQAMADAGTQFKDLDPFRVGVIIGSGIGGLNSIDAEHRKYIEKGPGRISVFFIPMMIANMAAGTVAMKYGFKGANFSVVTACASGAHSLGEAFRAIKYGHLDAALAGGAEAAICEFGMGGFENMGALCTATDPDRASIPFDKERCGFVMGEGAGVLVLEEYEHAKARGAKIYAELAGYGATADAYHITSPDPTGEGPATALKLAMAEAGAAPEEIGYINAHGTSTGPNDACETQAIKLALGDAAQTVAISSTKSMTGHLLGAAGAVEAIACALALRDGVLPPTVGYRVPDEECDLDYITEGARKSDARYALSNSLGFGGHNATLCLRKL